MLLALWASDRGLHPMHAGLIGRAQRGVLLPGRTGSGKSTALGLLAMLTTPVFSVVAGGVVTVMIAVAGLRVFPELRRLGSLPR